ncbi:MAG: phosphoribosylglycinamide formyltransferase [Bacteroidetes bacterium]|nr:phosphoribosylglycinamide formyltransferase [Bacteroidota bacterium]
MINIAVFASGNGSNAVNIYNFFKNHPTISFKIIYCNNPTAGIISKAKNLNIECRVFNKNEWQNGIVKTELIDKKIDFVILAGFLWLVNSDIIKAFENRILNIHPSLLPNYGGKGMYGDKVHHAVIENKENESGITIHIVNDKYDEGKIVFQDKIRVETNETIEKLAAKIHELEYKNYPKVIENYILNYKIL